MGDTVISNEPLEILMASGTVRGTCLLKNGEVIFENFPFSAARLVKICRVVEGLTKEYTRQGRSVDQMAFGYDGGNLLAVSVGDYRVIFLHLMSDEIDFLAKAARAHMEDLIATVIPERSNASLDTVPISLVKTRIVTSAKVEETARIEIPSTNVVTEEASESGAIGLSPKDMSVEDLVGYYSAQSSGNKE